MSKRTFRRLGACICLCVMLMGQVTLPAHAAKFKDVSSGFWAANEINRCVELGFFKGQQADRFGVGAPMTRASFAVVLCRFFNWKVTTPAHSVFSDVSEKAWYAPELQAAYENGVFAQQGRLFRPDDPITRGEIAVALVRALGYGPLAATAAEEPLALRDVYTNRGYIAIAYELGLVTGYANKIFLPNQSATREQVAVMLIRMYDKLHQTESAMVVAAKGDKLTNMEKLKIVAVSAAKLSEGKTAALSETMGRTEEKSLTQQIHEAGKTALLHITGSGALKADPSEVAALVAQRVTERGYEGAYLDLAYNGSESSQLVQLVSEVRKAMPKQKIYVAIDGTDKDHLSDYHALSSTVDQLVVKIPAREQITNSFPIAVMEPMDVTYVALTTLRRQIPAEKLILQITTTGSAWNGSRKRGEMVATEIQKLQQGATSYQSEQYSTAYLRSGSTTVWYLGADGIQSRTQLATSLGVQGVCYSSLNGLFQ